jgi:large subunit ribosomal protein L10e
MGLRPGRCYRGFQRPYTRQATHVPAKAYVKGVPKPKITEFQLGSPAGKDLILYLVSKGDAQIRHNALEASRIAAVQLLEKALGKSGGYFIRVRVYPHHVLRENSLATGAGADRFQQGMRASFGSPIGTAARVKQGQKLFEVHVQQNSIKIARDALMQARHKLPVPCKIVSG